MASSSVQQVEEVDGIGSYQELTDENDDPNIDGGWAYAVVVASFIIQVIICGIQLTFGVLFLALMEEFGTDESTTSWIVSIEEFFMFAGGMVVSPMLKKFGFRAVTVFGSILSCVGMAVSSLPNNVYTLYFTYGVLVGFGCSLQYFTTIISIQYYFRKHRSKATGVVVSGMGVGLLVFGILVQFLLNKFGWRHTVQIEASFLLLGGICGLFIRPMKVKHEAQKPPQYTREMDTISKTTDDECCERQSAAILPLETSFLSRIIHRLRNPDHCKQPEAHSPEVQEKDNTPLSKESSGSKRRILNGGEKTPLRDSSPSSDVYRECCEPMDFSLYRDPVFILVCFSSLTYAYGEVIPWIYIPDRAVSLGVPVERASFLISVIGIANIASRLVFGYVSDISAQVRFILLAVMIFVEGTISTCSILLSTYPLMVTYAAVYGMASGSVMAVLPVVMTDLFGYDKMDMAIAQSLAVRAIAVLLVAPTTGNVVVATRSVDTPIIMAGASQILAGILFVLTKCFRNRSIDSKTT